MINLSETIKNNFPLIYERLQKYTEDFKGVTISYDTYHNELYKKSTFLDAFDSFLYNKKQLTDEEFSKILFFDNLAIPTKQPKGLKSRFKKPDGITIKTNKKFHKDVYTNVTKIVGLNTKILSAKKQMDVFYAMNLYNVKNKVNHNLEFTPVKFSSNYTWQLTLDPKVLQTELDFNENTEESTPEESYQEALRERLRIHNQEREELNIALEDIDNLTEDDLSEILRKYCN